MLQCSKRHAQASGAGRGRLFDSSLCGSGSFCCMDIHATAHAATLEPQPEAEPCPDTLRRINESLQARDRLLTASARASRLLLEAADVTAAVPGVLGLLGEAARVDRVSLMQACAGPDGERLLAVVSEWTGTGHGRFSGNTPVRAR